MDTNIIIEAKRIGVWNALSGAFRVVTVTSCIEEAKRGSFEARGYVSLSDEELSRVAHVHTVTPLERARYRLQTDIDIDRGEEDLLAYAYALHSTGDKVWVLCSADKAAVRAAMSVGLADRLVSLGSALGTINLRPRLKMRDHFVQRTMEVTMTEFLLR